MISEAPSKDLNHFEMTEEVPVLSESTSQCLIDSELEKPLGILTSVDIDYSVERLSMSSLWNLQQAVAKDEWQKVKVKPLDLLEVLLELAPLLLLLAHVLLVCVLLLRLLHPLLLVAPVQLLRLPPPLLLAAHVLLACILLLSLLRPLLLV
ncbi:hypothetical protein SRHO_G00112970 [Serrasalmus rhombeus]